MRGHPWHPAIVHFPLACWVLATLVDVSTRFAPIPSVPGIEWGGLSHLLLWAGEVLAVPAIIAGLYDYARTPTAVQDSADLLWHIALMTTAWMLFLGVAIWRVRAGPFDSTASWPTVLIQLAGLGCLVAGGHFAATIVFELLPAARKGNLRDLR